MAPLVTIEEDELNADWIKVFDPDWSPTRSFEASEPLDFAARGLVRGIRGRFEPTKHPRGPGGRFRVVPGSGMDTTKPLRPRANKHKDVVAWAAKALGIDPRDVQLSTNHGHVHPEIVRSVVRDYLKLADKYPSLQRRIGTLGTANTEWSKGWPEGVVMGTQAGSRRFFINPTLFSDHRSLGAIRRSLGKLTLFGRTARELMGRGGPFERLVTTHEVGHLMHYTLLRDHHAGYERYRRSVNIADSKASRIAVINEQEHFAELFAARELLPRPSWPRELVDFDDAISDMTGKPRLTFAETPQLRFGHLKCVARFPVDYDALDEDAVDASEPFEFAARGLLRGPRGRFEPTKHPRGPGGKFRRTFSEFITHFTQSDIRRTTIQYRKHLGHTQGEPKIRPPLAQALHRNRAFRRMHDEYAGYLGLSRIEPNTMKATEALLEVFEDHWYTINFDDVGRSHLIRGVAKALGVTDARDHRLDYSGTRRMDFDPTFTDAYAAYGAQLYKHTQDVLRATGVKDLVLWRGVKKFSRDLTVPRGTVVEGRVRMNALSSYTVDPAQARLYAGGSHGGRPGLVIAAKVPAAAIWSVPKSGPSFEDIGEVVVLGGNQNVKVYRLLEDGEFSSESTESIVSKILGA